MDERPFDQPPNCAVFSIRQIIFESAPILHVTHDSDDHGWQFLGLEDPQLEDASVVTLAGILDLDPSIREVADLLPGWHAWRREVGDRWIREPK